MTISETYNEDCMALMARYPDKHFDLAVVDPPYGIGKDGQTQSRGGHGGRKAHKHKGWDKYAPDSSYFKELFRVSKNQIIWGANYYPQHLPPSMGWIFWDKGQRIAQSDGELAFSSFNRALRVIELNRVELLLEGTIHPTQKPIRLYTWIFKHYAKPGQLILDTHLGSGSSRIAADKAGLNFVGCELDPDYFAAHEKRWREYKMQLKMF